MIPRPALAARVAHAATPRVLLIAPAGYGKSTLVAEAFPDRSVIATIDLERIETDIDILRRFVQAAAPFQSTAIKDDLPQSIMGLGDDAEAWQALASSLLPAIPTGTAVHIENAESLAHRPDWIARIDALSMHFPPGTRVIVCSRVAIFQRPEGADADTILTAHDLRLTRVEIATATAGLRLSTFDLDAVERFTEGWPIVVMMLVALGHRGQLQMYLKTGEDVADLYGYLASEVVAALEPLQRQILEAVAAVPNISRAELALIFDGDDVGNAIDRLSSETPFVVVGGESIAVHPALREQMSTQIESDEYRERLFTCVPRDDAGVRAAEIALLRGRPRDAAQVLIDSGAVGSFWTPSHADVFSRLPDQIFIDFPVLWGSASFARASRNVVTTMLEGQRLLSLISPDTPPLVRIDVMSSIALLLANRGHLNDAQDLADQFELHPGLIGEPLGPVLRAFFTAIIGFYRGDPIDHDAFLHEFDDLFGSSTTQQAFREGIISAPYYRMHGDERRDSEAVERGVAIARETASPLVVTIAATYAAFGAWFWGHLDAFDRYVAIVRATAAPSFTNMFSHFIACLEGRGLTAATASEKLDMRTYGFAIAATRTTDAAERRALADAALLAAQHSSQRFCEVIARVILASCDPTARVSHLERALQLAREIQSLPLASALEARLAGDASGTMLASLTARLDSGANGAAPIFRVDLRDGRLRTATQTFALSPRERALLIFLAEHRAPVDGAVIARALWPDSDARRGLVNLRVTINRLRARAGSAAIVDAHAGRYQIGAPVHIDHTPGAT